LNRADHCWIYAYPRGQWRGHRTCPGFKNESLYAAFRQWEKRPTIKTLKDIRRDFFRTRRRTEIHHVTPGERK